MLKRNVTVEYDISPKELAEEFSNMTADDQAEFFNELYGKDKTWPFKWAFQLQYVQLSDVLNDDGREMMRMIGEYSG